MVKYRICFSIFFQCAAAAKAEDVWTEEIRRDYQICPFCQRFSV